MSYGQIFIALLGWSLLFYLSNRTLRRTEISRLKDRLVDKVDGVTEWLANELHLNDRPPLLTESTHAAKVTQIELKIRQINHYTNAELINSDCLTPLRDLDVSKTDSAALDNLSELSADIIEHIEISYDNFFFKKSILARFWITRKDETKGATIALAFLVLIFYTMSFIWG